MELNDSHLILYSPSDFRRDIIRRRCADYILRDEKPFRVFVYADVDSKLDRCMKRKAEDEHLTEQEMKKRMASIDKGRAKYYEFYSDRKWGARENYDLMVNTSGQNIKVVTQAVLDYLAALEK